MENAALLFENAALRAELTLLRDGAAHHSRVSTSTRDLETGTTTYTDATPHYNRLQDCSVVVTGAAGGIGRAIAVRCAQEGAHVVVMDRTCVPREHECLRQAGLPATTIEAIVAALMLDGATEDDAMRRCVFVQGDVSVAADHQRALDAALALSPTGRLDLWVNNAAIGTDTPLLETSDADFEHVQTICVGGYKKGCEIAVRQMLTQEPLPGSAWDGVRGRIVNITSQHGMVCAPNDFAYGVGKAATVYLTKQIAVDYARFGIICNAVAPGKIVTGKAGAAASALSVATAMARTPYGRLGRPLDVAKAVVFLGCGESSFICGENLMVDGGWMAG